MTISQSQRESVSRRDAIGRVSRQSRRTRPMWLPIISGLGIYALSVSVSFADHDIEHQVESLKGGLGAVEERVWNLEQQIPALNVPRYAAFDANGDRIGDVISFTGPESYLVSTLYLLGNEELNFLLPATSRGFSTGGALPVTYWEDENCDLMPLFPIGTLITPPGPDFDPYVFYYAGPDDVRLLMPSGDPAMVLNEYYVEGSPLFPQCGLVTDPMEFVPVIELESDIYSVFPPPFSVERVP